MKDGKKSGYILDHFKSNIDRPLTAILTINTFANMVGAAGVGAQTIRIYGESYMAVASVALTFVVLIGGEIIPKTIGATYWKPLAPFAAYAIQSLVYLTYPVVKLTENINKVTGIRKTASITREEMIVTAEMGASDGSIKHRESLIIQNLLKLDETKVSEIMTPRSVIMAYDAKETVEHLMKGNKTIRFSRIPVYNDNLDNIVGLLHRYKLMEAASQDLDDLPISKLMVPIHSVPESVSVAASLDQFIKRKEHLFLVVDEYGVPSGIVTLEDAIETLIGQEIVDETDSVVDMRQHALEQWKNKKKSSKAHSQQMIDA